MPGGEPWWRSQTGHLGQHNSHISNSIISNLTLSDIVCRKHIVGKSIKQNIYSFMTTQLILSSLITRAALYWSLLMNKEVIGLDGLQVGWWSWKRSSWINLHSSIRSGQVIQTMYSCWLAIKYSPQASLTQDKIRLNKASDLDKFSTAIPTMIIQRHLLIA